MERRPGQTPPNCLLCVQYKVSGRVLTFGIAKKLSRSVPLNLETTAAKECCIVSPPFPPTYNTERKCCTFRQKEGCLYLSSAPTRAMCLAYLTLLDLIILLMPVKGYPFHKFSFLCFSSYQHAVLQDI